MIVFKAETKLELHHHPAKLEQPQDPIDYYQLLATPQNASLSELKAAYHRALLQHHPDKQNGSNSKVAAPVSDLVEVSLIKEAYETLSSLERRIEYDAAALKRERVATAGPRPAQVISLEDWTSNSDDDEGPWGYSCRCSGYYEITLAMMERGVHLVGCSSCSEVIWAGYESNDP